VKSVLYIINIDLKRGCNSVYIDGLATHDMSKLVLNQYASV